MTEYREITTSKCYRCGSHLALGLGIVHIARLTENETVKLCGQCMEYLQSWLRPRRNSPA